MNYKNLFTAGVLLFTSLIMCADYEIGTYYFAGWWRNPVPAHYLNGGTDWRLTYPEREPAIGWYDDMQSLVDQEILLASLGGITFFAFDYFTDRPDSPNFPGSQANNNNGLKFFLTSPNKHLMKFALMYSNAPRFEITTTTEWEQYCDLWVYYFQDPQYLKINGKPVFIIEGGTQIQGEFGGTLADGQQALLTFRQKAQAAGFPDILVGGGIPKPDTLGAQIKKGVKLGYNFLTAYSGNYDSLPDGANNYDTLLTILPDVWDIFKQYSTIGYAPITIQGHDPRPLLRFDEPYFINLSPLLFNQQLQLAKTFIDQNPALWVDGTSKMVIIHAWNEIGSGGELIPTLAEGNAYLAQVNLVFV